MDSGDVIQGLDDQWTFMGARMFEWIAGFATFMIISNFFISRSSAMPFMLGGWFGTTLMVAHFRKKFPDEERGIRNGVLTYFGLPSPGIPAPSLLKTFWSGAPVKSLPEECGFIRAGLDKRFPSFVRDLEQVEIEKMSDFEN